MFLEREYDSLQGKALNQYNPMKPVKCGYKLWVRADMDGYIRKFDVYQGKTDTSSGDSEDSGTEQEFGLGEQVVQTMSKDLFGKYHQVYFENFFLCPFHLWSI